MAVGKCRDIVKKPGVKCQLGWGIVLSGILFVVSFMFGATLSLTV